MIEMFTVGQDEVVAIRKHSSCGGEVIISHQHPSNIATSGMPFSAHCKGCKKWWDVATITKAEKALLRLTMC